MRYYIGIDIGWKGAISIIDKKENSVKIYDMPEKEKFNSILDIFIDIPSKNCIVGIEKQHPFPKQGVLSVFSLGWQYGYINSILESFKMPYVEISPRIISSKYFFIINKDV